MTTLKHLSINAVIRLIRNIKVRTVEDFEELYKYLEAEIPNTLLEELCQVILPKQFPMLRLEYPDVIELLAIKFLINKKDLSAKVEMVELSFFNCKDPVICHYLASLLSEFKSVFTLQFIFGREVTSVQLARILRAMPNVEKIRIFDIYEEDVLEAFLNEACQMPKLEWVHLGYYSINLTSLQLDDTLFRLRKVRNVVIDTGKILMNKSRLASRLLVERPKTFSLRINGCCKVEDIDNVALQEIFPELYLLMINGEPLIYWDAWKDKVDDINSAKNLHSLIRHKRNMSLNFQGISWDLYIFRLFENVTSVSQFETLYTYMTTELGHPIRAKFCSETLGLADDGDRCCLQQLGVREAMALKLRIRGKATPGMTLTRVEISYWPPKKPCYGTVEDVTIQCIFQALQNAEELQALTLSGPALSEKLDPALLSKILQGGKNLKHLSLKPVGVSRNIDSLVDSAAIQNLNTLHMSFGGGLGVDEFILTVSHLNAVFIHAKKLRFVDVDRFEQELCKKPSQLTNIVLDGIFPGDRLRCKVDVFMSSKCFPKLTCLRINGLQIV